MAKLTVNYKNMQEGTELDIPPHGLFINGRVYDVEWLEEDKVLGEELPDDTEVHPDPRTLPYDPESTTMPGADIPAEPGRLDDEGHVVAVDLDNDDDEDGEA